VWLGANWFWKIITLARDCKFDFNYNQTQLVDNSKPFNGRHLNFLYQV